MLEKIDNMYPDLSVTQSLHISKYHRYMTNMCNFMHLLKTIFLNVAL